MRTTMLSLMNRTSRLLRMSPSGTTVSPRVGRFLLVGCYLSVGYGTADAVHHPLSPPGLAAWGASLLFCVAFYLATYVWARGEFILLAGLSGAVIEYFTSGNSAFVAVVASIAVAGLRLEARPARVVALIIAAGFLLAGAASAATMSPTEAVSVSAGLLFTFLGSTAVRRLRTEQQRTRELLEEAIAGRDARVRAAALDERARLAREMHDVLAHTLSALSIQLEGTRLLAEQSSADIALVAALDRAGRLAREGLSEARRAVGSLRDESLPGPERLPDLVHGFEQDTGVTASFRVEGSPAELSADVRLALYRIAQESLTNVRKHARAASVAVILVYAREAVELTVEDTGHPQNSDLPGSGFGLNGMRERTELLGGTLEAGPTAEGFRVRAWIPTGIARPSVS